MEIARQSILIGLLAADIDKKATVSDAEIQAEYDKFKAQSSGTEYRVRHILVEKEDEAKAIVAQLKAGAKFEDLAKKNSKDPGSAENGGDLDFANARRLRARVLAGDDQAEEGRLHRRAGEDASSAITSSGSRTRARPSSRRSPTSSRRSSSASRSRRRPRSATSCAPRRRPTTSSPTDPHARVDDPRRRPRRARRISTAPLRRRSGRPRCAAAGRSARRSSVSWVTSTSVVPASRFSSNISAITVSPVAKSRLPVGSSASSSAGLTTKARASATRCCSPPGEHPRIVAQPLAQADPPQHLGGQRPRVGSALQLERQHHVLQRVQVGEQLEALEDEADLLGADRGARVLVDREQVDAGEPDRAGASACRARR